jgi:circadian clock protein KaiB
MSQRQTYKFRLYVVGDSPNSAQAMTNLKAFCGKHLPGRHAIEFVDIIREPRQALAERVFLTPTLIKLSPGPMRRIVGTLKDSGALREILGLPPGLEV